MKGNALKIIWRWDYGVYMPFCPYCDEVAEIAEGKTEKCRWCNGLIEWVEPKHKPTVVQVGDYTVVQSTNKHISIADKDGKMIYHAQCNKKQTEEELRGMVDLYLKLTNQKLWKYTEQGTKEVE